MADDSASIRMTVDDSQATAANQKYVRGATETFNVLIQRSRELNLNEKQRIQWLEREIELLKERNRLGTAETVNRLYDDPALTGKQRSKLIRETRAEGREDVEEIKELNKQFKQYANDSKIAQQKAERMGQGLARMLPGVLSADSAGGLGQATSSGVLAGLGIAGVLAGITISKGLRGAATMEAAIKDYAILRGGSFFDMTKDTEAMQKRDLWKMGMTPAEYFPKAAQLERAGGGVVKEDMVGIIAGERAKGISLAGVMGVERYGGGTVTNIERYFERYLRATAQSVAVLPEILQTYTQEGARMLRVSGRVDSAAVAASIATVGKTFGLTGEPLQAVYSSMQQGLQQSTNPAVQAMQFSAMSRALGSKASLLQMQMAMENPMENPQYVVNMLSMLKQMTGGGDLYTRAIFNMGLAPSLNLAQKMSEKDISLTMFDKEKAAFKKTGVGGYRGEAEGLAGATETLSARIQGGWQYEGFRRSQEFAKELNDLLEDMATSLSNVNDAVKTSLIYGKEQFELAKASSNELKKVGHILLGLSSYGSNIGFGMKR